MRKRFSQVLRLALLFAATTALPTAAQQAAFPTKPIRLVVTVNPGNVGDVRARQIADKLSAETAKALKLPDVRSGIESTGGEIGGDSPEQFQAYTLAEYERWGKIMRDANIRLD